MINLLGDLDSFVYLSVIHTIKNILDVDRKYFLHKLLVLYENEASFIDYDVNVGAVDGFSLNYLRKRILVGEVIQFGIRRAGNAAAYYADDIINSCFHVVRADKTVLPSNREITGWNLRSMTIQSDSLENANKNESIEDRSKTADFVLLRQSAVSILAEVVAMEGYAASRHLVEILMLSNDILKVEYSSTNVSVAMRRYTMLVII
jgi:hypothetical protein